MKESSLHPGEEILCWNDHGKVLSAKIESDSKLKLTLAWKKGSESVKFVGSFSLDSLDHLGPLNPYRGLDVLLFPVKMGEGITTKIAVEISMDEVD